ncbi:glycerophosphoryl diester phosphodiesterase membrane domain-containing protein [Weissella confusa]|uniref:glycerophosphoryl diester phosphodiesterase membrane domain-containing protein n=1 Tax=Weissella confusa TaxID=1583 RepID=UPI001FA94671|nr:glycerophosphoryl diester phosphodiesterase membrane domain-containing protein [Weissella confusa]
MKQSIWTLLWRRFWQSKWTLSRLFFSITILISVIVVPVLKGLLYVGQWLDEVPFMSLSNVGQVLMQNPIFTVILVITVLILLTVFIGQLARYTIGFSAVHDGQRPTAISVMKTALHRLRQGGVGAWILILFYGIVVLPFPMLAFHSQLTADLIIPQFVWPTITGTPWMLTLIWVLGLAALFFAIRFFYVLPEIMLAEHKAGRWANFDARCVDPRCRSIIVLCCEYS